MLIQGAKSLKRMRTFGLKKARTPRHKEIKKQLFPCQNSWFSIFGCFFPAKNECHPLRTDGCQHFCHPGENSYMCSCAKGYKLGQDHKSCIPHGESQSVRNGKRWSRSFLPSWLPSTPSSFSYSKVLKATSSPGEEASPCLSQPSLPPCGSLPGSQQYLSETTGPRAGDLTSLCVHALAQNNGH